MEDWKQCCLMTSLLHHELIAAVVICTESEQNSQNPQLDGEGELWASPTIENLWQLFSAGEKRVFLVVRL